MMSPSLNPKFFQIVIRMFQGQDLPAMDQKVGIGRLGTRAKIDAYMRCDFKKRSYKTKTITQFCDDGNDAYVPVDWNQEFWLPA